MSKTTITVDVSTLQQIEGNRSAFIREAIQEKLNSKKPKTVVEVKARIKMFKGERKACLDRANQLTDELAELIILKEKLKDVKSNIG